jgi:predicted TIM-barrel fold metal-dependent hydrolase
MISLMDTGRAVEELEWCLERKARIVLLRAAPVPGSGGSSSPGDPRHDPFWARVSEAGITVGFHAGDSGYGAYAAAWEPQGDMEAFRHHTFGNVTQPGRSIYDTLAALIIHGVFERHPNVRICSIENGAEWVSLLLLKLKKVFGQQPQAFHEDPIETFKRHIWIAPYYEDDIRELANHIGASQVLMGSDFPHAEGLADPVKFVDELEGFDDREVRAIMRDNTRNLTEPGWIRT